MKDSTMIHASYIFDLQLFISREVYLVVVNHIDVQVNMDFVQNSKKYVIYLNLKLNYVS